MSYKNDSHKGGSNVNGLGNSKSGQGAGGTSHAQDAKGNSQAHGTHGGTSHAQGTKGNSQAHGTQGGTQSFQPQDIKSLVHNQGRANFAGQEWALKAPSWNDATLQAIISDPKLTVKASSKPATDGKLTYELRGHGKTINVTIGR